MYETCCPQYTIRLEASKFKANKSQRQVLRRVERFLETGDVHAEPSASSSVPAAAQLAAGTEGGTIGGTAMDCSKSSSPSSKHVLTMETVPPANTPERFALYKKYQVAVHHDNEEVQQYIHHHQSPPPPPSPQLPLRKLPELPLQ
jgi:arginine-tRNA-protein transferase